MSSTQKIIKYFGIGIAFLLIFSIFSFLIDIVLSIGNSFIPNIEPRNVSLNSNYLDVSLKFSRLEIKSGDSFDMSDVVTVIVPSSYVFDDVLIDAGAGSVSIDRLVTKNLSFDIGVGNVVINDLVVYNDTSIDGGAGKFVINNGTINDLDYDMGAGDTNINAFIKGSSEIDCGVGKLDLNLFNDMSDLSLDLSLGIGSVKVNGDDVVKDSVLGTGRNVIEIDGGVGDININTK